MDLVRILVVEEDKAVSEELCAELRSASHEVAAAFTIAEGLARLDDAEYDVVLLGSNLPDGSGLDLLKRVSEEKLPAEVIVLARSSAAGWAIEAMSLGAYDSLTRPARTDEINLLVRKAADKSALRRENQKLRSRLARHEDGGPELITSDPRMRELIATLEKAALSELPVLIQGERGTGKALLARALHQTSPRSSQPFVSIRCDSAPEARIESQLFGFEPGASTGSSGRSLGLLEAADRGVLFLDEVAELSPALQQRLLRVLEAREFFRAGGTRLLKADVRVVSATDRSLESESGAGRFREDLYDRLNGFRLEVPPLRQRKGDIPPLALHFLDRFSRGRKTFTPGAIDALCAHAWPGNVSELKLVVRRAALAGSSSLDLSDLSLDSSSEQGWRSSAVRAGLSLKQMEREYIETVLQKNQGHRGRTARELGIDPKTLYNKLGAERPRRRPGDAASVAAPPGPRESES